MALLHGQTEDTLLGLLALLEAYVRLCNFNQRPDASHDAEHVVRKLFNSTFGYSLKNANDTEKNKPGIDLIDVTNGVAIQVSSQSSNRAQKMQEAAKKIKGDRTISQLVFFWLNDYRPSTEVLEGVEDVAGCTVESLNMNDLSTRIKEARATDSAINILKYELAPLLNQETNRIAGLEQVIRPNTFRDFYASLSCYGEYDLTEEEVGALMNEYMDALQRSPYVCRELYLEVFRFQMKPRSYLDPGLPVTTFTLKYGDDEPMTSKVWEELKHLLHVGLIDFYDETISVDFGEYFESKSVECTLPGKSGSFMQDLISHVAEKNIDPEQFILGLDFSCFD